MHLWQNMRSRNSLASGYSTDTFRSELAIVANAKLPTRRDVIPLVSKHTCRYISRMTRHPCLIRRTFLTCFSWVSYQWWSTTVNSVIGEYLEGIAVAALSSFHFPDSMPTTYAAVYLFSRYFTLSLTGHRCHCASSTALATDRLFLLFGSSRWYSYSNHEIFNDLSSFPLVARAFYVLFRPLSSFPIRLV